MQQEKKMTLKDQDAIIALQLKGLSLEDAIFNTGYEKGKSEHLSGAVWVKAGTRLPDKSGHITWRWIDKTESYAGYDEKKGFIFGTGGARVDPTYYSEIEWLDETGQSKEGNKEREEIERRNRLFENNLKLGMRLNRPGISEQEQEETWQDYKRRNNL